jgi:uncharacterized protein YndB with AHSA1/START domain
MIGAIEERCDNELLFKPTKRKAKVMKITVETNVAAPVETVWEAYTTPEDIKQWNAASDDWHTTSASVDLREGGKFSSAWRRKTQAWVSISLAPIQRSSSTN